MSLKELTAEKHELAEHTAFMKAVFARTLPMEQWVDYTYQKYIWYKEIEDLAEEMGLLTDLQDIKRADLIMADYKDMVGNTSVYHTYKADAIDYSIYVRNLEDPKKVLAHLYVWHMGDMFGGQMIKKIIEAPHRHLEFENSKELITKVRSMLTDDMADEANVAFDWAIKILSRYE